MISKEEFDRIDEDYAKRLLKNAEEYFGYTKTIYVRSDVVPRDSPLPTAPFGSIMPLKHKFILSDEQKKELQELLKPFNKRFRDIIIPSTDNPDQNSWLQNFMQTDMKPETKDKILFKFGEFVGTLSKEEKLSYNQIIGVLLDFIENNPK